MQVPPWPVPTIQPQAVQQNNYSNIPGQIPSIFMAPQPQTISNNPYYPTTFTSPSPPLYLPPQFNLGIITPNPMMINNGGGMNGLMPMNLHQHPFPTQGFHIANQHNSLFLNQQCMPPGLIQYPNQRNSVQNYQFHMNGQTQCQVPQLKSSESILPYSNRPSPYIKQADNIFNTVTSQHYDLNSQMFSPYNKFIQKQGMGTDHFSNSTKSNKVKGNQNQMKNSQTNILDNLNQQFIQSNNTTSKYTLQNSQQQPENSSQYTLYKNSIYSNDHSSKANSHKNNNQVIGQKRTYDQMSSALLIESSGSPSSSSESHLQHPASAKRMRISLYKQRRPRKEVDLEVIQEIRVQELREALGHEPDPQQIIIHQYAKKIVQKTTITKIKKLNDHGKIGFQTKLAEKEVDTCGLEQTRASKFRGVSKNGLQWQVQLGNTLARRYIGSSSSELEAARLYDRKAIVSNGLTAKTNFSYTKAEIEVILEEELSQTDPIQNDDLQNGTSIKKTILMLPTLQISQNPQAQMSKK